MTSPRPWRTGRKVGRTIYDAKDRLIGMMDTSEDAAAVVLAMNSFGPLTKAVHAAIQRIESDIESPGRPSREGTMLRDALGLASGDQ